MTDPIERFLADNADDQGNLSDGDMMRALTGDIVEGDTAAAAAESGAPDAALDAEAAQSPAAPDDEKPSTEPVPPTVLAKDGEHVIPYEKLVDARADARLYEQRYRDSQAEVERLRAATASQATPSEAKPPAAAEDPFGDFSAEALQKGIDKRVADQLTSLLDQQMKPLREEAERSAARDHFTTILTAHPDAKDVVQSEAMTAWVNTQPTFAREGFQAVLAQGSASQIVELIGAFKAAQPTPPAPAAATVVATAPGPAVDPKAKAQAIVAQTKPKPVISLSDIPAGTAVHHDEASAMAEMSPMALMTKFEGKTPEQIEKLLTRLV